MNKETYLIVYGGFHQVAGLKVEVKFDENKNIIISTAAAKAIKKHVDCGKKTCSCFDLIPFGVTYINGQNEVTAGLAANLRQAVFKKLEIL